MEVISSLYIKKITQQDSLISTNSRIQVSFSPPPYVHNTFITHLILTSSYLATYYKLESSCSYKQHIFNVTRLIDA